MIKQELDEFIEIGAALEHNRWSNWQEYMHSLCIKNPDGSLTISHNLVERWERQIKTPYSQLSESEKESDRIEVRKYLPLLPDFKMKWLLVSEEPNKDCRVLAWAEGWQEPRVIYFFGGCFSAYHSVLPTHWMPIPEPPGKEEK